MVPMPMSMCVCLCLSVCGCVGAPMTIHAPNVLVSLCVCVSWNPSHTQIGVLHLPKCLNVFVVVLL